MISFIWKNGASNAHLCGDLYRFGSFRIVLNRFFVNLLKHFKTLILSTSAKLCYTFILKIKLKLLLKRSSLESFWLVIAFIFCQSQHMEYCNIKHMFRISKIIAFLALWQIWTLKENKGKKTKNNEPLNDALPTCGLSSLSSRTGSAPEQLHSGGKHFRLEKNNN